MLNSFGKCKTLQELADKINELVNLGTISGEEEWYGSANESIIVTSTMVHNKQLGCIENDYLR